MGIYVWRNGQQYGPLTLTQADLFVAERRLETSDPAWSPAMNQWIPLFQVLAEMRPSPTMTVAPVTAIIAGPSVAPSWQTYSPVPPSLHWGLVLLLSFVTLGLFGQIWMLVQASFVKKIDPRSDAVIALSFSILCLWVSLFLNIALEGASGFGGLVWICGLALLWWGYSNMKNSMLRYYNTVENIGLRLGGTMAAPALNVLYFQYHLSRIAAWKKSAWLGH